jgi:hypothetical protein
MIAALQPWRGFRGTMTIAFRQSVGKRKRRREWQERHFISRARRTRLAARGRSTTSNLGKHHEAPIHASFADEINKEREQVSASKALLCVIITDIKCQQRKHYRTAPS